MPSSISWLDGSRAEQQQVRELLRLGRDSESRDELGIGQVRDAFSDRLFPGTSTLHTRARYLLIVPWCHEYAARQKSRVALAERVDRVERRLIGTLLKQGKPPGMHGARTGPHVKALPTVLYWGALREYGIRLSDEVAQLEAGDLEADRESKWDRWNVRAAVRALQGGIKQTSRFEAAVASMRSALGNNLDGGIRKAFLAHS